MISVLRDSFRRDFAKLPKNIQQRARAAYKRFKANPDHPSLQFKALNTQLPLWSVRITKVSQGTLNETLTGKRAWSKSMILKVADFFGLSADLFLRSK